MKSKKQTRWMRFRHRIIRNLAACVLGPYVWLRYRIKIERFRQQNGRQYLIVMNHQTAADQFFVGLAFKGPVYYLASEDLFSNGFISRLLSWAVAPIPIKKQTSDYRAVINCMKVAKEGGTIALAPEGNRTFRGKTEYIKPSLVGLMKKLQLPLAVFRIEGGYGVQPRWSDVVRRGPSKAYVSRVIEPEEYNLLSNEELYQLLSKELAVDEANNLHTFRHKKSAEFLERVLYVCPKCGLSSFESKLDTVTCCRCGLQVKHLPTTELQGVGESFPYRFVSDWYDAQCDFVNALDYTPYLDTPMYTDSGSLSTVELYSKKTPLFEDAKICLYGDRITVNGDALVLPFREISVITVLGRNKLNIYHGGNLYQIKSHKRFNAVKYMNIFYHYKNRNEGDGNGKFLGL